MSSHEHGHVAEHEKAPWIERWWPALVITFGILCIIGIDVCHPML
jgi:hypothetical protein